MLWWLSRSVKKGEQPPWIVPDELCERIEPLLPVVPQRPDHPGRKRLDNRKVLSGILFVLYTGIPWEFLPQELGFGSGMTCWRRLRDWHQAGVWQRLHESLAADPMGDPRRHPRGLPQPRLRDHLLAPPAQPLTLLGPLSVVATAAAADVRFPGTRRVGWAP